MGRGEPVVQPATAREASWNGSRGGRFRVVQAPLRGRAMRRAVLLLTVMAACLVMATAVALAVNKVGTNGPDTLRGTDGADNLLGRGGNDVLLALAGRDKGLGGTGNHTG